jgi:hypothetical protein
MPQSRTRSVGLAVPHASMAVAAGAAASQAAVISRGAMGPRPGDRGPHPARTAAGRRRGGGAPASATAGPAAHTPLAWARQRQGPARVSGGHGPTGPRARLDTPPVWALPHACNRVHQAWDAPPPRGGVTRGGVRRRPEPRGPRTRPAPDGRPSGGRPPPTIRVLNRRMVRAPPLPRAACRHRTR